MFAKAVRDPQPEGYKYEFDSNNQLSAIVITGTIYDGTPDANGNLLDATPEQNVITLNWQYRGAFRIDAAALAALPPQSSDPTIVNTPSDPRYQAIMVWLAKAIDAKHKEITALKTQETRVVTRDASEMTSVGTVLTPDVLAQLTAPAP